ncbi:hypothetical protein ABFS82_08G016200 [Erythranthe guttata]|uniref:Peroxidase n=1 Tax=Erythranthe guttata TaxID=4155 RepID=A0A022RY97_ERYGU|nr:PREDICTED: peroxidase 29-like [Erythranthe guttata]EYU44693.1 hypothetical protein MIMGU_mgv1a009981mg [Erythranthe guttata]|eukprot:XP_012850685.1 PREDICTED: peroxidase 29-like [Erythranthe guttata]
MDLKIVLAIVLFLSPFGIEGLPNGLSFDYYSKSCPQVEKIVRDAMNSKVASDPKTPAAILRLVFHDCQVGGCDGSVLLNINDKKHDAEFDSPKNFGIRNRELIDEIKTKIEKVCPQKVSCADTLVLAARDGVAIAGGPTIKVPLGRKDTTTPHTREEADKGLPRNNVDLTKALQVFFQEVGITLEEVVAIIGAHTLGKTHCDGLKERLYLNSTKLPPGNEAEFVKYLKKTCPEGGPNQFTTTLDLDPTPQSFDNKYYVNVLNGHGLISLDAEIARDPRSIDIVKKFAHDQDAFFKVFSSAFVKISTLAVLTGDKGIVRKKCSVLN